MAAPSAIRPESGVRGRRRRRRVVGDRPAGTLPLMIETADVIVVGAGVQGASLAFHLARRGAERAGRRALGRRSRRDRPLERLRPGALRPRGRIGHRLGLDPVVRATGTQRVGHGDPGFVRTGFLQLVGPSYADALRGNVANQRALGIATEVLGVTDARRLAPSMTIADDELAAYEPGSGYADPTATATGFLAAARAAGARYMAAPR